MSKNDNFFFYIWLVCLWQFYTSCSFAKICECITIYSYNSIYSYNTFFMETYLECHDEIFSEAACQLIWHLSREQTVAATKTAAFVPPTHLFNLPPCFESDFFTIYQKIRSIDMACDTHCMTRPKFSSRPFPRLSLDNFF